MKPIPSKLIVTATIEVRDNRDFLILQWNNRESRKVYRILYDGDTATIEHYTFHGYRDECMELEEAARILKNKADYLLVGYYHVTECYYEPYLLPIKYLLRKKDVAGS